MFFIAEHHEDGLVQLETCPFRLTDYTVQWSICAESGIGFTNEAMKQH